MPAFTYPVLIQEEAPGEFIATFRDIPEAITGAPTRAEALNQAIDALAVAVEGYLAEGLDLPDASPAEPGETIVSIDPALAARVALVATMAEKKVSGRALAERMQKDERHVRRILAGQSTIEQSFLALRALGVGATLSIGPLAEA